MDRREGLEGRRRHDVCGVDSGALARRQDDEDGHELVAQDAQMTLIRLLEMSRNLRPEPIITCDDDGVNHFATADRPLRIVVDVHNLTIGFGWLNVNSVTKTITVSLDGEVLVYRRVGKDLHGWWVCDRVHDGDQLHEGDRASGSPQA